MNHRCRARTDETGLVTVWGFLLMVVLLGFMGLAIDFWHIWEARRDLTAVADAAALAGAGGVDDEFFVTFGHVVLDLPEAEAYANDAIDAQPDLPVLTSRSVVALPTRIDVSLTTDVDLSLMRIFTASATIEINADATANPYRSDPCSPAAPPECVEATP